MEPQSSLPFSQQPATDFILKQMHPVHKFPLYSSNIHPNIILPSTPRSSTCSLPFGFSEQNFVCIYHLSRACYMFRTSHPPLCLGNDTVAIGGTWHEAHGIHFVS